MCFWFGFWMLMLLLPFCGYWLLEMKLFRFVVFNWWCSFVCLISYFDSGSHSRLHSLDSIHWNIIYLAIILNSLLFVCSSVIWKLFFRLMPLLYYFHNICNASGLYSHKSDSAYLFRYTHSFSSSRSCLMCFVNVVRLFQLSFKLCCCVYILRKFPNFRNHSWSLRCVDAIGRIYRLFWTEMPIHQEPNPGWHK